MSSATNYIAYYRVSTQKQGISGLGLEAQQKQVEDFATKTGATIAGTYTEVESGKKADRVQLLEAIAEAKKTGATLLIAKLDRLARNASFIFHLRDTGVKFVAADMPDANTLTVGIFAIIAQNEAEVISSRTKAALAAKKARGEKMWNGSTFTVEAREKGRAAHIANAANNQNTKTARGYAALLHSGGASLRTIAATLNKAGFKTARGGQYSAVQVARLFV